MSTEKVKETLIERLREELNRNRSILAQYHRIGPAGTFGAILVGDKIKKAEKAIRKNDVVEMMSRYIDLKETE